MDEVEELVAQARATAARILRLAGLALFADADANEVQRIVSEVGTCLEDIEAYALLGGIDGGAEAAIRSLLARLQDLESSLTDVQGT